MVGLQPAARADAQQPLDAELDRAPRRRSSRRGSPCPSPCTETGLPSHVPGVAEQPALARSLRRRRRGTSRRCTSPAAGRRGGGRPRRSRRARHEGGSASAEPYGFADRVTRGTASRVPAVPEARSSPSASRSSRSAREDPVERVFLEDVARRGLGRFVALARRRRARRALPSRRQRRPLRARTAARSRARSRGRAPRMLIGEERAVVRALGRRARTRFRAARGPAGPAGLRHPTSRPRRRTRACAPATLERPRRCSCRRARPRTSEELGVDPMRARPGRLPLAHAQPDRGGALVALGRGRRDPLQGGGVGVDARGGPAPAGLGRPRGAPARVRGARARAISAGCCSSSVPTVCLFVRAENDAGDPALRDDRDGARARLPLAPLLSACATLLLARHGLRGSNRDGVASCAVPGRGAHARGRRAGARARRGARGRARSPSR